LNQQTQLAASRASLSNASVGLQLASPTITAPYAGTISDINIVEGMVISSSTSASGAVSTQRMAVIKNNSTPIVNVSLSEIDVPSVKIGQKATVIFDSISGETFTGVVATVDRIGSVSSNVTSYTVNIKLDSASDKILPNMAATANIITQTAADVLEVPSTALVTTGGQIMAKTLVNGTEVDAPVEVGISSDSMTQITSGLTEGETVITGTKTSSTSSSTRSVFSGSTFGAGGGGAARVIGR
jgi:multidrug efflux pump subunit AcrA (membrane-fusion protein)